MLQVSSGLLRGLSLRSPSGKQTRPSSERLRQSTFNVLRHFRWQERASILEAGVVVDLFSGTGAWGIEAMSNGASDVWFVESHPSTLRTLEENLTTAYRSFESQRLEIPVMHLVKGDVSTEYKNLPEARVIFCDPPYDLGWFEKVLFLETQASRLTPGGVLLYEAATREAIPAQSSSLKLFDTKIYGDSSVHFFVKPLS
jgi:16S rRNA (guanine966-N2)-methyltransferase